jgi:hypothetical protein
MVSVSYATSDGTATSGSDYASQNGILEFAPGQTEKLVTILVSGDTTPEPDESFTVNLFGATNAAIADSSGTGTIVNDDADPILGFSINDVQAIENNTGVQGYTFIVTLSFASASTVTVDYTTVDGTATVADVDYYAKSGTVTFLPSQTSKVITIQTKGDRRVESDEEFFVQLSAPTGGATVIDGTGVGTILNDDGLSASSTTVAPGLFDQENAIVAAFAEPSSLVVMTASTKALEVLTEVKARVNPAAIPGIDRALQAIEDTEEVDDFAWAIDLFDRADVG